MRKLLFLAVVVFANTIAGYSQTSGLKFRPDGSFKIVQFTDLHYQGNEASQVVVENINKALDSEKPDFVIFTGDVVLQAPVAEKYKDILQPLISRKIPYAVLWGNHDQEHDMTREELQKMIEKQPYNVGFKKQGIPGESNFILTVKSVDSNKSGAVLYCLDSHSYSTLPDVPKYGWISHEQVIWYVNESARLTKENGGKPLPALAFYHIAVPEYNLAAGDETVPMIGWRMEVPCSPGINTGFFAATKIAGDVMGHFVGHDHDNDYVANWQNVYLGFGRFSGGKTTYNNMPDGPGARVFILTDGERTFKTYVRLVDGTIQQEITYPKDLKVKVPK